MLLRFRKDYDAKLKRLLFLLVGIPSASPPQTVIVLDPHSPTVCDDVRCFLKYKTFESIPLAFWSALDSATIRRSLRVSAVQFRGATTRWNFIRLSWANRRDTAKCFAHVRRPLWRLNVSSGTRQRLLLPLQHAKRSVCAREDLQSHVILDSIRQCDDILERLHELLDKVSG